MVAMCPLVVATCPLIVATSGHVAPEDACLAGAGVRAPSAMGKPSGEDTGALIAHSLQALGMLQTQLADLLGVSPKTISRWLGRGAILAPATVATLAGAVHAKDPALAARIAAAHGHTMEELGIAPVAGVQRSLAAARRDLADAIVCAAAEVADVSPRAMRAALAAAVARAREAGVTLEEMGGMFAGGVKKR